MSRITLEQVVLGSEGLNQKRRAIKAVVGTFVGVLKKLDFPEVWKQRGMLPNAAALHLEIGPNWRLHMTLRGDVNVHFFDGWKGAHNWHSSNREISSETTRLAYPTLQTFIDRVLESFPGLETSLEPITAEAEERAKSAEVRDWNWMHPSCRGE